MVVESAGTLGSSAAPMTPPRCHPQKPPPWANALVPMPVTRPARTVAVAARQKKRRRGLSPPIRDARPSQGCVHLLAEEERSRDPLSDDVWLGRPVGLAVPVGRHHAQARRVGADRHRADLCRPLVPAADTRALVNAARDPARSRALTRPPLPRNVPGLLLRLRPPLAQLSRQRGIRSARDDGVELDPVVLDEAELLHPDVLHAPPTAVSEADGVVHVERAAALGHDLGLHFATGSVGRVAQVLEPRGVHQVDARDVRAPEQVREETGELGALHRRALLPVPAQGGLRHPPPVEHAVEPRPAPAPTVSSSPRPKTPWCRAIIKLPTPPIVVRPFSTTALTVPMVSIGVPPAAASR